jgi:Flp pilus assembly protein TadD
VRLEPENPKLVSNLGILALRMGRSDEAREHFEKVLARSPEDPLAREYLRRLSSGEL